jgi:thermitase
VHPVFVDESGETQIATDLITLQVDPDMQDAEVQRRIRDDGLRVTRRLSFAPNTFEVTAAKQIPLIELIASLQDKPYYRFAEPMLLQSMVGRFKPTDPGYINQWQHNNDGSNGGTAHADIQSEAAWEVTKGRSTDRPMRIAIIDNGMQISHPDLKSGIVGGGYFQSNGFGSANFVRFAPGMSGFPNNSHGTFCTGIAGARANNRRGGCGAAPEADLLAIACIPDQVGTQVTLARALAYAIDPSHEDAQAAASAGADVVSCSLGPNGADWALTSVLDLAIQFGSTGRGGLGTPIFWAVSNGVVQLSKDEVSSHAKVIAIGCSTRNDLAEGSAYGPKLDLLAPGADVYSTTSGSRYGFDTGTSFAAPLTAGVAALVLAKNPGWTASHVQKHLRATADKIGGVVYDAKGHHDEYGYGRLNAARAVSEV